MLPDSRAVGKMLGLRLGKSRSGGDGNSVGVSLQSSGRGLSDGDLVLSSGARSTRFQDGRGLLPGGDQAAEGGPLAWVWRR